MKFLTQKIVEDSPPGLSKWLWCLQCPEHFHCITSFTLSLHLHSWSVLHLSLTGNISMFLLLDVLASYWLSPHPTVIFMHISHNNDSLDSDHLLHWISSHSHTVGALIFQSLSIFCLPAWVKSIFYFDYLILSKCYIYKNLMFIQCGSMLVMWCFFNSRFSGLHYVSCCAPVCVNPQCRGMGNPEHSDISPRRLWQKCSDPEAVLTFTIKRFPPPGVANAWKSDTKVQVRVGSLTKKNQMSDSPGSAYRGGEPGDSHWLVR